MPEEPSSDSVSASELDFSTLSLDSGMDRLSRLADSLIQGMSPASLSEAQQPPGVPQDLPLGTAGAQYPPGVPQNPCFNTGGLQHPRTRLGSAQSTRSDLDLNQGTQSSFASQQHAQRAVADNASGSKSSEAQLRAHELTQPQSAHRSTKAGGSDTASLGSQKLSGSCHDPERQLEASDACLHMPAQDGAIRAECSSTCSDTVREANELQRSFSASDTAQARSKTCGPGSSAHVHNVVSEHSANAGRSVQMSEASGKPDTESLWHHSLPEEQRMSGAKQAQSSTEHESSNSAYPFSQAAAQASTQAWHAVSQPQARDRSASLGQANSSVLCDATGVSASEASSPQLASSYAASEQKSQNEPGCLMDDLRRGVDSVSVPVVSEQQQQEGLLSDSEDEFERSIETAKMLRPVTASQPADRYVLLLHDLHTKPTEDEYDTCRQTHRNLFTIMVCQRSQCSIKQSQTSKRQHVKRPHKVNSVKQHLCSSAVRFCIYICPNGLLCALPHSSRCL